MHQRLETVAATNKGYADRKRSEAHDFQPGGRVWLSTHDLRELAGCRKLTAKYPGSFKIVKKITPVTYRLDRPHPADNLKQSRLARLHCLSSSQIPNTTRHYTISGGLGRLQA